MTPAPGTQFTYMRDTHAKFAAGPTLAAILAVIVLAGVSPASAARNREAQSAWVEAYDHLEEAEEAERQDDVARALNLYREARKQFLAVHRQAPQWNPSLVNYRIKYCLRKIQALEKELRLTQSSRDRGELVKTLERQADRIAELTRTSENLEYKLQIASEALERARTEAARHVLANHRVPQLLKENKSLEQERDNLKQRVENLRQKISDGEDANLTVKRLKQQMAENEVRLGEAKAEAAEARRTARERSERIDALADKLHLAAQENRALKRQIADLKQAADKANESDGKKNRELRDRLDEAEQQLDHLRDELAETQKRKRELSQTLEDQTPKDRMQERIDALEASRVERKKTIEEQKQTIAELRKSSKESQNREAAPDPQPDEDGAQTARLRQSLEQERERARELEKALHEALADQERQQDETQPAVAAESKSKSKSKSESEPEPHTAEQTIQPPSIPGEKSASHNQDTPAEDENADRKDAEPPQLDRETRAFLKEGLRAEETGNTEAAVWNYRKVIEASPENMVALHRLGLLAAERGDDEKASRYLRRAARQAPEKADVLIPLGFSLARQEKPYEAIGALAQAIAAQPDDARPHRALGVAASSLGWYDIAEREMKEALRIAPEDSDSAFNLAILLASKEPPDMDEARRWYLKARDISGQSDPALDRMFNLDPPSPDEDE